MQAGQPVTVKTTRCTYIREARVQRRLARSGRRASTAAGPRPPAGAGARVWGIRCRSGRHVFEVSLNVLLDSERDVRVSDPLAERLPVDLRVNWGGVAVADVVQVDFWQPGRRELLEASRDRVGMRRPAIRPAEQHTVIVVVRPEILALLVEHLDMRLQNGQRERVEGQHVLSVFRLAVRLDHLAVHDDARDIDLKRARGQIEQIAPYARELAAPHARRGFEHPQCEEAVRSCALQKRLELSHGQGGACGAAARRQRRALPWEARPPHAGPHFARTQIEMAQTTPTTRRARP